MRGQLVYIYVTRKRNSERNLLSLAAPSYIILALLSVDIASPPPHRASAAVNRIYFDGPVKWCAAAAAQ